MAASLALLSSCVSNQSESSSVSSSSEAQLDSSSVIPFSSEVSSEASSEVSTSSASSDSVSSETQATMGDWTLGPSALSDSAQSQYLNDYAFAITDSSGYEVSFYGDYVQRGKGEWENTIQMKKEVGVLECRTKGSGSLNLVILKRIVSYSGEDHDYTGVPSLYVSSDLETWSLLEGDKKDGDTSVSYSYSFSSSYWRMTVGAANALYLSEASFSVSK